MMLTSGRPSLSLPAFVCVSTGVCVSCYLSAGFELRKIRKEWLRKNGLALNLSDQPNTTEEETIRKDLISHYVLRVAYCRTDDLRRWFLKEETELFTHRFGELNKEQKQAFLLHQGLPYESIGRSEYNDIYEGLKATAQSVMHGGDANAQELEDLEDNDATAHRNFYKVPFTKVPGLVRKRSVYLRRGFAYLHVERLSSLVAAFFRASLSKALTLMGKKWLLQGRQREEHRLTPIVESLSARYLGQQYDTNQGRSGQVRLQDIPSMAKKSFPLCMGSLVTSLHKDHHLKHNGRRQLTLFLKGIGLPMEDCLAFFKQEFSTRTPGEKFDKEYAYNIRHSYGKEGKRADYRPWNCLQVIEKIPGVGECHGCPYRHFDEQSLRAALTRLDMNRKAVEEVVAKAQDGHYQIACGLAYDALHDNVLPTGGINHPNEYFDLSWQKLYGGDQNKGDHTAANQPGATAAVTSPTPHTPADTHRPGGLVGVGLTPVPVVGLGLTPDSAK